MALQIFRLMEEKGWQAAFEQYLAYTRQGGNDTFLGLLHKAGLENPMEKGSLKNVAREAREYLTAHQKDLD